MDLPRLIIADESRAGGLPSGVITAAVLKALGHKIKVFIGGVDEISLATVERITGDRATLLDPILCGGEENLRCLFEASADPSALNIVIAPLGYLDNKDVFHLSEETKRLRSWLNCQIVPAIYEDASSTISVKVLRSTFEQLGSSASDAIHAHIFRAVASDREYQLADKEAGRASTALSIGMLPKAYDRSAPPIHKTCDRTAGAGEYADILSSVEKIAANKDLVCWPFFAALAKAAPDWPHAAPTFVPLSRSSCPTIGIVRDPALTLGGDGTERLMRALGAQLVDIPIDGATIDHLKTIHGLYIPHGLGYLSLKRFLSNKLASALAKKCSEGSAFLFAEGGASPMLGASVALPPGIPREPGESPTAGLGAFPLMSIYGSTDFSHPKLRAFEGARRINPLLFTEMDMMWGYISDSVSILPMNNVKYSWVVCKEPGTQPIGEEGVVRGRAILTTARLEPWSAPNLFKKWLGGEDAR